MTTIAHALGPVRFIWRFIKIKNSFLLAIEMNDYFPATGRTKLKHPYFCESKGIRLKVILRFHEN